MNRRLIVRRAEGQSAVLAALCFAVMVGFLGLAIDGSNAFGQRRRLANATDAAALAGARALLARRNDSGAGFRNNSGTRTFDAIEEFLTTRHELSDGAVSWRAYYVDRLDPEGSLGEVVRGSRAPSASDGVRVEVSYSFDTYFMGVFGRRELGVGGRAAAVFGPLGTAIGQDLAPLALSNTGRQILMDQGTVRIDLRDSIADEIGNPANWPFIDPLNPDLGRIPLTMPADVIASADVKHVSFAEVSTPPETGDDCLASSAESLTFWWCQGSPNKLRINRQLPTNGADLDHLSGAIEWRENHRPILVLPEYGDIGIYYEIVSFVAVELRSYNSATGVLTVERLDNYATAGAMVGEGSGVETGVWAVNLTR